MPATFPTNACNSALRAAQALAADNDYGRVVWHERCDVVVEEDDDSNPSSCPQYNENASPWSYYIEGAKKAFQSGDLKKSEALWLAALQIAEPSSDADLKVAYVTDNLLNVLLSADKLDEAHNFGRRALALLQKLFGTNDLRSINCMNNLAGVYYARGCYKQAQTAGIQVLCAYNRLLESGHVMIGIASRNLAMAYHAQGLLGLAELSYERALPILKAKFGPNSAAVAEIAENYARALDEIGNVHKSERVRSELYGSQTALRSI